ncbi:MAG TPA: flippase-like domain-containing protein [bacterium]|mgnify:CR=1 FL=1|nr:flippase-like domain-containing protein [bacterium]HPR88639.1 flippase-like domain-containing protein [bacterium]
MSAKKSLSVLLRWLISIVLIGYVLYKVDLGKLWQTISQADWFYFGLSIALTPLLIFLSSWKWQVILRAQGIHASGWRLFWLYMVGYFFNTVLPTNVGGDVVRAWALGKATGENAKSFASVFIERFTGLTALILVAVIAFFAALRALWDAWLGLAMVVSVAGYLALLVIVFNARYLSWMEQKVPAGVLRKIVTRLKKFQEAILSIRGHRGAIIFAMVNSFAFYLAAVVNVWVSALAFRCPLTFLDALIITPIIMVIMMLPVSIGGIGLAEWAYFFTFDRLGFGGAAGLSVALLMRLKALVTGVLGGIYYSTLGIRIDQEVTMGSAPEREIAAGDVAGEVRYFSGFEDVMRRKRSPLHKYAEIVIGPLQLWRLIKYEMVTLFCMPLPGMIGYALRQISLPALLRRQGKGTVWSRNVTLRHPHKISVGKRCVIEEYCSLSAQGDDDSAITLGEEVLLGRGTVLGTRNGIIEIGDYSNIGANCRLGTTTRIRFGKHVLLAANCYIGGAQHKFDRRDVPIMRQGYESKGGVVIEDDVWLGAGVMVLDGVTIGTGSVIGAAAVVTRNVPPYSIALGIPAKVVGTRS